MNQESPQHADASFEAADDLLWQAVAGRLPKLGSITLARSGRIGPLVELAMATVAFPEAYRVVTVEPAVYHQVMRALGDGTISGAGARDRAGVFPLSRFDPFGDMERIAWDQWAKHAENAAVAAGLAKGLVGGLLGALGELQDNVFEHSGRPDSGVVAYAAADGAFEFVVADAGRGVSSSTALRIPGRRCASRPPTARRGTRATPVTDTASAGCFVHSPMMPPS